LQPVSNVELCTLTYIVYRCELFGMLNKEKTLTHIEETKKAFYNLKDDLVNTLGVFHRVQGTRLIVDPDASNYAVGSVVSQVVEGVEQPLGIWSTPLRCYKLNWHIYVIG